MANQGIKMQNQKQEHMIIYDREKFHIFFIIVHRIMNKRKREKKNLNREASE